MTQHFWNRWSSEHLTLLQSRSKWHIVQKNLDIGDLVLIKNDNSPPLQWKLGKVTETFPGKDGKVRVVKVLDETRSFFRVHTGYFSNIPKCIKAEFIASWACSQSSVVSSSQR
ncbi:integrase catalytic domain-containing protein [Trichonephila clavipes]|nr:integrase catalytic domain-containing protein [Trichonephila clavipes]